MLGRYFARFDESPTNLINIYGELFKEYWGEDSSRAKNWQIYDIGNENKLAFEEGVESYVPYVDSLNENVRKSLQKIKATMCNCGAMDIEEFRKKAKLTLVSPASIIEGGTHDVILKNGDKK